MNGVEQLLAEGRIESVEPDAAGADAALDEARRHLGSAARIAADDPNGSYQMAYDAARKVITAHLRSKGLRIANRPAAHEATALYARAAIDDELGQRFDRMRRNRNRSEYGVAHFEPEVVEEARKLAERLVQTVEQLLA